MSKWFFTEFTARQQEMIDQLRGFYERQGRRPYVNELGWFFKTPVLAEILKEFPSYKDALRAAHLPVLTPGKDDLIDAVLTFCQKNDWREPTRQDAIKGRMLYGPLAFDKVYRNWQDLLDDARPEIERLKAVITA